MITEPTYIADLLVLYPEVYTDHRGCFSEIYKSNVLKNFTVLQENESISVKNVLRGLHLQKDPFAQNKLVRCVLGEILDVAVDMRTNSSTYLKHFKTHLSDKNKKQLFIPKGFAHGFLTLSDYAIVSYKVDVEYHPECEQTFRFDDPKLNIDWEITSNPILSEKDSKATWL